jgi:uncharacterized membrane protein
MRWGRRLQGAAVCVALGAYAGLSHYCNSVSGARDLGAALALGPITAISMILAWRWMPVPGALLTAIALAGLLFGYWPLLTRNFPLISLVEGSGIYALLGLTFGQSLLPGRVALCTRLADRVHGPLSAHELRYTWRVTAAWTMFFFVIAAMSVILFLRAPLRIWSIYTNFCVLPLVGAMFLIEYLVRRRALPGQPRAGLLATVRVYLAHTR